MPLWMSILSARSMKPRTIETFAKVRGFKRELVELHNEKDHKR